MGPLHEVTAGSVRDSSELGLHLRSSSYDSPIEGFRRFFAGFQARQSALAFRMGDLDNLRFLRCRAFANHKLNSDNSGMMCQPDETGSSRFQEMSFLGQYNLGWWHAELWDGPLAASVAWESGLCLQATVIRELAVRTCTRCISGSWSFRWHLVQLRLCCHYHALFNQLVGVLTCHRTCDHSAAALQESYKRLDGACALKKHLLWPNRRTPLRRKCFVSGLMPEVQPCDKIPSRHVQYS